MTSKFAFIFIITGSIILVMGVFMALKSTKPMYFNVVAGLIILVGRLFGLFGKQLQDKSSSEKSDIILKTGDRTFENTGVLKK
jgi:hypothetical protein